MMLRSKRFGLRRWSARASVLLTCLTAVQWPLHDCAGRVLPAATAVRWSTSHLPSEQGCAVCHPGAQRGLQLTPHREVACTECHGPLDEHVKAAASLVATELLTVEPVAATACASCHGARQLAPRAGGHALPLPGARRPPPPDEGVVAALAAAERDDAIRWQGLLDLGYRLVHVVGSREGYRSDVDLDPGVRLRGFDIRGIGGSGSLLDELHASGQDLGDPRWRLQWDLAVADRLQLDGSLRRDRVRLEGEGDYHRVDRRSAQTDTKVEFELTPGVSLFGSYLSHTDRGYWLTQRIGDQAVVPLTWVDGVESPRDARGDEGEFGVIGELGPWLASVAVGYRDETMRDRWLYSQPALANPAFSQSEDFRSRSTLRGPSVRTTWRADLAGVQFDCSAAWFSHTRRLAADGEATGFDTAQYETTTTAFGSGMAETVVADATVVLDLSDALSLRLSGYWRDHDERMSLQQTQRTVYPGLPLVVDVHIDEELTTAQRLFETEAMLQFSPTAGRELTVGAGYGVAHEWLRVPRPDPVDPRDFSRGYTRDAGPLAELDWRLPAELVLHADWRDYGTDGVPLHELVASRDRAGSLRLTQQSKAGRWSIFLRQRRAENTVSGYSTDVYTAGCEVARQRRGLSMSATYAFSRNRSRTLTNFYFDPDPDPLPTFVGFDGDTHAVLASLRIEPDAAVGWESTCALTRTTGSFDVRTLDWSSGVRVALGGDRQRRQELGVDYRRTSYDDAGSAADWHADLVFAWWRVRW